MKTPEGRIKTVILRYLERRGFFAWNNPTGTVRIAPDRWVHFGKRGSADIIGILPDGKSLAVECKPPTGRLTPDQKAFLEKIRGLGGVAIVARSSREIDGALRANGYSLEVLPLFNEGGNNAIRP